MIHKFNHPILKTVCQPIDPGDDLSFLADMRKECDSNNGVGLAAPQIGIARRAIYIANGESLFMVNPEIVWKSPATATRNEGCLSYPGVFAPIERCIGIKVSFLDEQREQHVRDFAFLTARIIQHEVDHLDGICLVGDAWRAEPAEVRPAMIMALTAAMLAQT